MKTWKRITATAVAASATLAMGITTPALAASAATVRGTSAHTAPQLTPEATSTLHETCSTQVTPTTWFNVGFNVTVYHSGSFGQIDSVSGAYGYLTGLTYAEGLSDFTFASDISGDLQSVYVRGDAVLNVYIGTVVVSSFPVACWGTWPITSLP